MSSQWEQIPGKNVTFVIKNGENEESTGRKPWVGTGLREIRPLIHTIGFQKKACFKLDLAFSVRRQRPRSKRRTRLSQIEKCDRQPVPLHTDGDTVTRESRTEISHLGPAKGPG